jgi:hypothetical protein
MSIELVLFTMRGCQQSMYIPQQLLNCGLQPPARTAVSAAVAATVPSYRLSDVPA